MEGRRNGEAGRSWKTLMESDERGRRDVARRMVPGPSEWVRGEFAGLNMVLKIIMQGVE